MAIRSDSDAWQIEEHSGGGQTMPKFIIDGKEFELDSVVKSHIEKLQAQLEAAQTKATQVDAWQGRYDALEIQLQKTENELKEAKEKQLSEDEMHKKVEARVALITSAKPLLGDSFDFTGKTEREIKEAVISASKADFKGDGKSDEYINAFFDATVEQVQAQGFSSTGANSLVTDTANTNKDVSSMRAQRLNLRD